MHWLDEMVGSAEETANARRALLDLYETSYRAGSWAWHRESGRLAWSPNMFRIFGFEEGVDEPSVELMLSRIHPDDVPRIEEYLGRFAASPDGRDAEDDSAADLGQVELRFRMVDPAGEIQLLQARIATEVDMAGGRILVGLTGDITQMLTREREFAAHIAVCEALAAWEGRQSGIRRLLQGLARAFDFTRGALWLPRDGGLFAEQAWSEELGDEYLQTFDHVRVEPGQGLVGRTWKERQPLGASSARTLEDDPLVARLRNEGLHGALALPALHQGEVLAVIGVAGQEPIAMTDRLEDTLSGLASQLGAFFARRGLSSRSSRISQREIEVLQLAADGHAGADIARLLYVSPATVKSHFENIYAKYGTRDRVAAVAKALREGLIR